MKDNPIGQVADLYRSHVKNPIADSALTAALVYSVGKYGWRPLVKTLRSAGRPILAPVFGKGEDAEEKFDTAMENLENDESLRGTVSAVAALAAGGGRLASHYRPNEFGLGLTKWDPGFKPYVRKPTVTDPYVYVTSLHKSGSYIPFNYDSDIDWSHTVGASEATRLFTGDPHFDDYPYSRHMGTAIVNNAARMEHTSRPTLGGIFDSAVDKIDKKLTFGGLAKVGIRTAVANGAARLFTSALGQICDLSPSSKQALIDAGTWAGAITAILE